MISFDFHRLYMGNFPVSHIPQEPESFSFLPPPPPTPSISGLGVGAKAFEVQDIAFSAMVNFFLHLPPKTSLNPFFPPDTQPQHEATDRPL